MEQEKKWRKRKVDSRRARWEGMKLGAGGPGLYLEFDKSVKKQSGNCVMWMLTLGLASPGASLF